MTDAQPLPEDSELIELRGACPEARRVQEAGESFVLLPQLYLGHPVQPARCDVLLRTGPSKTDGYHSRLLFAERPAGTKPVNWNSNPFLLQRQWHAYSWQVPTGTTGLALLTAHLKALR